MEGPYSARRPQDSKFSVKRLNSINLAICTVKWSWRWLDCNKTQAGSLMSLREGNLLCPDWSGCDSHHTVDCWLLSIEFPWLACSLSAAVLSWHPHTSKRKHRVTSAVWESPAEFTDEREKPLRTNGVNVLGESSNALWILQRLVSPTSW